MARTRYRKLTGSLSGSAGGGGGGGGGWGVGWGWGVGGWGGVGGGGCGGGREVGGEVRVGGGPQAAPCEAACDPLWGSAAPPGVLAARARVDARAGGAPPVHGPRGGRLPSGRTATRGGGRTIAGCFDVPPRSRVRRLPAHRAVLCHSAVTAPDPAARPLRHGALPRGSGLLRASGHLGLATHTVRPWSQRSPPARRPEFSGSARSDCLPSRGSRAPGGGLARACRAGRHARRRHGVQRIEWRPRGPPAPGPAPPTGAGAGGGREGGAPGGGAAGAGEAVAGRGGGGPPPDRAPPAGAATRAPRGAGARTATAPADSGAGGTRRRRTRRGGGGGRAVRGACVSPPSLYLPVPLPVLTLAPSPSLPSDSKPCGSRLPAYPQSNRSIRPLGSSSESLPAVPGAE